jgi:DNA-binding beta-propeller fold protein YncE
VIDTATHQVTTVALPFLTVPKGIAITPDGAYACVTGSASPTVTVFATATSQIMKIIGLAERSVPIGIAITPDGTRAYVANSGNGNV